MGDWLSGVAAVEKAQAETLKEMENFENATFHHHKWHSNEEKLENNDEVKGDNEGVLNAKQKLEATSSETKVLRLPWDKENDTLRIEFPKAETEQTKSLSTIAKVYHPLGLVSQ